MRNSLIFGITVYILTLFALFYYKTKAQGLENQLNIIKVQYDQKEYLLKQAAEENKEQVIKDKKHIDSLKKAKVPQDCAQSMDWMIEQMKG